MASPDELGRAAGRGSRRTVDYTENTDRRTPAHSQPRVDADALSKVAKALNYFDGCVALSVVISVFKEFDTWMAGIDPARAVEISEAHRLFVNYRAEADSNR